MKNWSTGIGTLVESSGHSLTPTSLAGWGPDATCLRNLDTAQEIASVNTVNLLVWAQTNMAKLHLLPPAHIQPAQVSLHPPSPNFPHTTSSRVNVEEWPQISLYLPVWSRPKPSHSLLFFYFHPSSKTLAFWSRGRAQPKTESGGRKADSTGCLIFILLFTIQYRHCFKLHKNSL